MTGKETITEPKGAANCASANCGMDAGCRRESDGSWICICTQDLSVQRADGFCPRVVVAQYPRNTDDEDRIIRMWENESIKTWMMENPSNSDENSYSNSEWIFTLTILVLMAIITVIAVSLIIKRRKKLDRRRQQNHLIMDQLESFVNSEQQNLGTKDGFILLREWIKLEEEIGQGCFGLVYRGRYQRPGATDSETVAVKVLKTNNRAADESELIREAQTMATFSHPNILGALGIVFNGIAGSTWLVFEYMSMGDLTHLLRTFTADSSAACGADGNPAISLREIHLMSMAEQIASGMAYLSTQRFIHRDLACRNCLVNQLHNSNSFGSIYFIVKISDFGMSRDVYTTDYYRMGGSQSVLPVRWMSPESILYGTFTTKSDVWSYGIVLWEIFTMGAQPYYGQSNEEAVKLILDGVLLNMPEWAPTVIQQIYDGCSKSLPVDRLTFHQIENELIADQQRRVPRSQGSVCSYIIPNPIMLDGPVRFHNKMRVVDDENPIICREIEGNMQAVASVHPVDDPYLQLVIHTDSTGENLSINIP